MTLPSDIPEDQLQRIQPVLDRLLTDLRGYTRDLAPSAGPATDYRLEAEASK
jgi:hypothetical protein